MTMKRLALVALLALALGGCATTAPYGNFVQPPVTVDQQQLAGDAAKQLAALWPPGHEALAKDLPLLVREPVLRPPPPAPLPDPTPMLQAATGALLESARVHADGFRESLLAARWSPMTQSLPCGTMMSKVLSLALLPG